MNPKEFEAVINRPANIRYEYFIKKVADFEEVWGLFQNGWAVSEDDYGNKLMPLWPKKEFAEYCAIDEWEMYSCERMDLYEFVDEMLPKLKRDGYKLSIFMNNIDSAVLDIETLIKDLQEELDKY